MKNFILGVLISLIYLPIFAQQCEEGDIHLLREGDIVFLKECRSGVLNNPFADHISSFLEVHKDDPTFMSAFDTLDVEAYGFVDRVFGIEDPVTMSLSISFEDRENIEYIADKYRQWTLENELVIFFP